MTLEGGATTRLRNVTVPACLATMGRTATLRFCDHSGRFDWRHGFECGAERFVSICARHALVRAQHQFDGVSSVDAHWLYACVPTLRTAQNVALLDYVGDKPGHRGPAARCAGIAFVGFRLDSHAV